MARFRIYYSAGEYRWTLYDNNRRKIATSGEGFSSKYNVKRSIENIKYEVPGAGVEDAT